MSEVEIKKKQKYMVESDSLMIAIGEELELHQTQCPSRNKLFVWSLEDGCLGGWTNGLGGWFERFGYIKVLLAG